nr:hypothetical protein CFP56_49879 [Quercus suber]
MSGVSQLKTSNSDSSDHRSASLTSDHSCRPLHKSHTNALASPRLDPITVHNHTRVESAEKQKKEEERELKKLK